MNQVGCFKNSTIHQGGQVIEQKIFATLVAAKRNALFMKKKYAMGSHDGHIVNPDTYLELVTNY